MNDFMEVPPAFGETEPSSVLLDEGLGWMGEEGALPRGFFVTGTDTGVGKTVIAGALLRALRILGLRACGMKPIETGCRREGDVLIPPDGMFLKDIAHVEERIDSITPVTLFYPLAPMVAAEKEGARIDLDTVMGEFRRLMRRYDAMVVEGVGGLLVPITKDYSVADLASDLRLPLIVVSSPLLGTINHTRLTVQSALAAKLEVAGVIVNYHRAAEGTLAEETNPHAIERLLSVPFLGVMPHLESLDPETLDAAVVRNLDMETLRRYL